MRLPRFVTGRDDAPGLLRVAAIATAVVLLAITLGIGIGLEVGLIRLPGPRPAPSIPTATPDPSQSPSEDTFESATSLGTVEWTKVTSDAPINAWTTVGGEILGMNYENETLWQLGEDMVWEPAPAPELGLAATYFEADGSAWAVVSPDGYGVMMGPTSSRQVISREYVEGGDEAIFRREGDSWTEVPLPDVALPATAGLRILGPRLASGAAVDPSSWVVPVIHHIEVPWGDIFGQYPRAGSEDQPIRRPWPIWDETSGQLRIVDPGAGNPFSGPALATLSVELGTGGAPSIEFRDSTTGEFVHAVSILPGWSAEGQLAAFRGWGLEDMSFLVNRGGEVTLVRPPWPMGEEPAEGTSVVAAFGRYFAMSLPLGDGYEATAIHLWESTDGLEWAPVELPSRAFDGLNWAEFGGREDALVITVHEAQSDWVWTSTDGRQWTEAELGATIPSAPVATDFGWVMGTAAISDDGRDWEVIDLPLLTGEPAFQYLGGLFFYGPGLEDGEHVTWIGHLAGGD